MHIERDARCLLRLANAESGLDRARVGHCRSWRGSADPALWSEPPIEVRLSYGEVAICWRADGLVRQVDRAVGIGDRFSQAERGGLGPVGKHLLPAAEQERVQPQA